MQGTATNIFMVFQLADLRLAIKTGPRERDTQIIPFSERVREFVPFELGENLAIITESGRIYKLADNGESGVVLTGLIETPSDVLGISQYNHGSILFDRDGTMSTFDQTTGRILFSNQPVFFLDKGTPTPRVIQLIDKISPRVLFVDGISRQLIEDGEMPIRAFSSSISGNDKIRYEIGLKRRAESISGYEYTLDGDIESWKLENIAVRTDYYYDYRGRTDHDYDYHGLFQLGDRTTVSYSYTDTIINTPVGERRDIELIKVPTGHRTQFIAGYELHGLIILD